MRTAPHACDDRHEREARAKGFVCVAGVDEVGRGCLFGPVVAAAVVLPPGAAIAGLRDSKQLSPDERERLAGEIRQHALSWAVAHATVEEIDQINILQASRLAMRRAVESLLPSPDFLLVDAVSLDLPAAQLPLIHGDALSASIAAASILAKVQRDAAMVDMDAAFPGYGIARHKGYGTPEHLRALRALGLTPLHRRSFAPVREAACL